MFYSGHSYSPPPPKKNIKVHDQLSLPRIRQKTQSIACKLATLHSCSAARHHPFNSHSLMGRVLVVLGRAWRYRSELRSQTCWMNICFFTQELSKVLQSLTWDLLPRGVETCFLLLSFWKMVAIITITTHLYFQWGTHSIHLQLLCFPSNLDVLSGTHKGSLASATEVGEWLPIF